VKKLKSKEELYLEIEILEKEKILSQKRASEFEKENQLLRERNEQLVKMLKENTRVWEARVETLEEANKILQGLVTSLTTKITELEAKLNKNSQNSNKPPSSDGPNGTIKNNRVITGRPSGGQPGHKGATLELNPKPTTVIELKPKTQCECGGLIETETHGSTKRQVTDIEPAKVITIEYRAQTGVCSKCGKTHKASFPENVNSTVSYGDNIQALVTYLTTYQLIPLKRASELVKDLLD